MQSYYLSALGHVRTGKLLEDLDLTAAYLALSHNRRDVSQKGLGVGTLPRIAVTASVERIDFFKHELHPLKDIIIEGRVTYAGRTTVETTLRVYQNDDTGHVQQVLKAHFIMAARCPTRKSGVRVHPLIASTTEEAARISDAEERVKERRKEKQHSLEVTNPTHEEFCQLHQNFLDSVKRKRENMHELTLHNDRQIWQHETQCTTFVNCHPVHQNFYGAVFGGFLMREAAELAQLTAKVFCKVSPLKGKGAALAPALRSFRARALCSLAYCNPYIRPIALKKKRNARLKMRLTGPELALYRSHCSARLHPYGLGRIFEFVSFFNPIPAETVRVRMEEDKRASFVTWIL